MANIRGFVGSDHVTGLLPTRERWLGDGVSLTMDISTNTEIFVLRPGARSRTSAPFNSSNTPSAAPWFKGGGRNSTPETIQFAGRG